MQGRVCLHLRRDEIREGLDVTIGGVRVGKEEDEASEG